MSTSTFNASLEMNNLLDKHLRAAMSGFGTKLVEHLAEKYHFSPEDALAEITLGSLEVKRGKKEKPKRVDKPEKKAVLTPSIVLPFCGEIMEGCCLGIRPNHGLYTQCKNQPSADGEKYCKTCARQAEKTANGKPTYGDIQDRMERPGLDYRDTKGKQVIPYGSVMEKLNISKEEAIKEADKMGWTIPEEQFEVPKKKGRGRPKKDASASDTDDETPKPKAKRGRPKKVQEAVETDDLISKLVKKVVDKDTASAENASAQNTKVASVPEVVSTSQPSKQAEPKTTESNSAKAQGNEEVKSSTSGFFANLKKKKKTKKIEANKNKSGAEKHKTEMSRSARSIQALIRGYIARSMTLELYKKEQEMDDEMKLSDIESDIESENESDIESDIESDNDALEVEKFEHNGVTYLKTDDNVLYSIETQEMIGEWDHIEEKIIFTPTVDDDDE